MVSFLTHLFLHNFDLLCIVATLYTHIQPGWDVSVRLMWMAVMKYLAMKEWLVLMFQPQARVQCADLAQWDSLEMDKSVWVGYLTSSQVMNRLQVQSPLCSPTDNEQSTVLSLQ